MHEDQFRGYELAILGTRWKGLIVLGKARKAINLELVSKELNHLVTILHVYAGGFEFYEVKKTVIIFQNENGNNFTLLIIFIVKSLQKEQNSTNLLL